MTRRKMGAPPIGRIVGRGLPAESTGLAEAAFDLLMGGETIVGMSGAMGKPRSTEWLANGAKFLAAFLRTQEEISPIMRQALAAALDGGPVDEQSPNPGVRLKASVKPSKTNGWNILDQLHKGQIGYNAYEKAVAAGEPAFEAEAKASVAAGLNWRDLQPLVADHRTDRARVAELEKARIEGKSFAEIAALISSPAPRLRGRPRRLQKP